MRTRLAVVATIVTLAVMTGGVASGEGASTAIRWSSNRPNVVLSLRTERPIVALTFDDGPSPTYTPRVLAILAAHRAHATFFDTGENVTRYPDIARRAVALGNEVGNHTWDHPHLPRLRAGQVTTELRLTSAAMKANHVREAPLFRPPYGAYNAVDDGAVRRTGKRVIGWDLCVEKELRGRTVNAAVAHLMAQVHPGSIILAHDAGDVNRDRTMDALPVLLAALQHAGYRVETVSQLLHA